MYICWEREDTIYFRPPGVFKWKIVFPGASLQNFLDSKNFLTKTLFLFRHLMPLIPEMVWVPLCFTLKTITVMSNTNYPVQYTIPVQDLDMDWFREQDWQKPLRRLFVFDFKLSPSENTERIVDSPNLLFLILKTKKLCSN